MKTRNWTYRLAALAGLLLTLPAILTAQQTPAGKNVVWQIGEFDQTSREFGHSHAWCEDQPNLRERRPQVAQNER